MYKNKKEQSQALSQVIAVLANALQGFLIDQASNHMFITKEEISAKFAKLIIMQAGGQKSKYNTSMYFLHVFVCILFFY